MKIILLKNGALNGPTSLDKFSEKTEEIIREASPFDSAIIVTSEHFFSETTSHPNPTVPTVPYNKGFPMDTDKFWNDYLQSIVELSKKYPTISFVINAILQCSTSKSVFNQHLLTEIRTNLSNWKDVDQLYLTSFYNVNLSPRIAEIKNLAALSSTPIIRGYEDWIADCTFIVQNGGVPSTILKSGMWGNYGNPLQDTVDKYNLFTALAGSWKVNPTTNPFDAVTSYGSIDYLNLNNICHAPTDRTNNSIASFLKPQSLNKSNFKKHSTNVGQYANGFTKNVISTSTKIKPLNVISRSLLYGQLATKSQIEIKPEPEFSDTRHYAISICFDNHSIWNRQEIETFITSGKSLSFPTLLQSDHVTTDSAMSALFNKAYTPKNNQFQNYAHPFPDYPDYIEINRLALQSNPINHINHNLCDLFAQQGMIFSTTDSTLAVAGMYYKTIIKTNNVVLFQLQQPKILGIAYYDATAYDA
ncbi:hypothetical protein Bealeia2_01993 (plasmid) [Candidatus Bealeia paramacronuclearis]|uniref:hypothetical protein n=1 Tax=Candidatus Bealeia paramacronuclearis TaxID=1921001 RepID=UPI002CF8B5C7|nr:hypothetical protein [Candidatus Bealeia paramacronuclearis]